MNKDLIDLTELAPSELIALLDLADDIKKNPFKYRDAMDRKTLLMIFEKPSLRTRVSFETGMTQMGGHGIYYHLGTSPMGKKETVADTAKTASRYVDIIMARLFSNAQMRDLAAHSSVPVINGLDDVAHPCQILCDLQTIREKKGRLAGLKLCYVGDSNNNVTHSLLIGCALAGVNIRVGCPKGEEFEPKADIAEKARALAKASGSSVTITHDAKEAARDADIIYTDSWMSYHIEDTEKKRRVNTLMPYQVNTALSAHAKKDHLFMNCLPAERGAEQTADVIDGPHSIVFDQAENRLHAQKALIITLLRN
ncbi:MAG: ornithine carbamoyltransferase [Nanoarchaeota archaeon]